MSSIYIDKTAFITAEQIGNKLHQFARRSGFELSVKQIVYFDYLNGSNYRLNRRRGSSPRYLGLGAKRVPEIYHFYIISRLKAPLPFFRVLKPFF